MWVLSSHECRPPERMPILVEDDTPVKLGDIWRCDHCLRNNRVIELAVDYTKKEIRLVYENCGY